MINLDSLTNYDGPDVCQKCLGWGRIANDDDQTPWKYWAEMPAPSNIAVTLGVVYPITCPRCQGCGKEPAPVGVVTTAIEDVMAERARQDAKWGEQNHDPFTYLAVLTEEVGELAQAALHARFGGPAAEGLRTEAVHVAAVALAIVECLDRCKWLWPEVPHE